MFDSSTPADVAADVARLRCAACGAERYELSLEDDPPQPDGPTLARPGSAEKLLVMIERQSSGRALHHPDDHSTAVLRLRGHAVRTRDLPPGICYDRTKRRYRARGSLEGSRVLVGLFGTVAEARAAMEAARRAGEIE